MPDNVKTSFLLKYSSDGAIKFYDFLIEYAHNRINNNELTSPTPEIEFINYYERFLYFYREEENPLYLEVAKIFRKAGNKIYRDMLDLGLTNTNNKFFNIII